MNQIAQKELAELCSFLFYETYPHGDSDEFMRHETRADGAIREFQGLKTSLNLRYGTNVYDEIVIATLFSDFSEIYLDSEIKIILPSKKITDWPTEIQPEVDDGLISREVELDAEYHFGFASERFLHDISPLIERGRLMLRPKRVVNSPQTNRSIAINRRTPSGLWLPDTIVTDDDPNELEFNGSDTIIAEQKMAVALPYIRNLSLLHLSQILDDEQDLLAEFRQQIADAIRQCDSGNITDIENDIVRPAVERVNRKFKQIISMHSLKIGGAALGSTAITLLSFADAGVAASIGRVLGPAGLGLVAKEISSLVESRAKLREMPHYLLWRIGKATRYAS